MHEEITGIASSTYITVSSSTGRATEPNSERILSHCRPLHELDNRAITLLFPPGVREFCLRPDRLWDPPSLQFNSRTYRQRFVRDKTLEM